MKLAISVTVLISAIILLGYSLGFPTPIHFGAFIFSSALMGFLVGALCAMVDARR